MTNLCISKFRNVDFLNRLLRYLANETGNLISVWGIGNFLKSQNVSILITVILNYLNYLTTAMLIARGQRSDIQGKKVFEVTEKNRVISNLCTGGLYGVVVDATLIFQTGLKIILPAWFLCPIIPLEALLPVMLAEN